MDIAAFGSAATGHLVGITGLTGGAHAFVPDPLPPSWEWPVAKWPLLLQAHKALASLDGTGKHLLNPELILRPLQNREAQRSSSLEGTFTDPVQQALFQLDPQAPSLAGDPANAFREVFNYSRALRLRLETRDALPMSLRLVRELHRTLMTGVRGSDKNPGEFRVHQNQIGRPPRYVPPPVPYLKDQLGALEKYLHHEWGYDPLVAAFLVHYQFEAIHPFMDGNGRVGRVLLAICIAEWCHLSNQWLYMSAYYDDHKDEYVDRLLKVSTKGDWEGWIAFCLRGVVEQSVDTQWRCERLLELQREFHATVGSIRGSIRLSSIIDQLFISPVTSVVGVQRAHSVTYPTARADLKKLASKGIIQPLKNTSQITYFCPKIFDVVHIDKRDVALT
ncbi:MAG: Fic family protein [Gemmatimonadota bacterium]